MMPSPTELPVLSSSWLLSALSSLSLVLVVGCGGKAYDSGGDAQGTSGSGGTSSGGASSTGGSAAGGSGPACGRDADCEDFDACTLDSCIEGFCQQLALWDDGDPCTSDSCDRFGTVSHTDAADDGDACTRDICQNGNVSNFWIADDGNACTDDYCSDGKVSHTPINPDDGDVCTVDTCEPTFGVWHELIDVDDENLCTFDDCTAFSGPTHVPVTCDFDIAMCGTASCDPELGCVVIPNGCVSNDGCCASGCTAVSDNDCCANLAASATPSKSTGGVGLYGPHQINNGQAQTDACHEFAWVANGQSPQGAYFQYAWPSPVTIGSFYVDTSSAVGDSCNPSGRNIEGGLVQYWTGSSWATATSFDGRHDDFTLTLPNPVTTTRLRLYDVTADAGTGNSLIYEWYVFPPGTCAP